jgi:maltoporin
MKFRVHPHPIALAAAMCLAGQAFAQDDPAPASAGVATAIAKKAGDAIGLEFEGYARGGFHAATGGAPKGGYSLGGDLQFYRLGNEGDNYAEFGIKKKFDLGEGLNWGIYYMPYVYNGDRGTAQVYSYMNGLAFAPELSFWAGQRFHRVEDIHIIDKWVMQDGDNYGAGIDGIQVGDSAKLNIAVHTDGSNANGNSTPNNGKRLNVQLLGLATNPGGKLNLTAGLHGGDYALGKKGAALGLLHNQKDFVLPGLNNSLFIQGSNGHSSITGQFYGADAGGTPQPGARQIRIIEAMHWQVGKLGGQALAGYQTKEDDSGPAEGVKTTDLSVGGRLSYGVAKQVKLLGEIGLTSRKTEGSEKQRLYKGTVAVAFSPNTDFWTRPEFRVYLNRANWNDAAAAAHVNGGYGSNGRTKATTFGAQMEVWW